MTDAEIQHLLKVPKRIINPRARWKNQRGSSQKNFKLETDEGFQFAIYLRQNNRIEEHFSCGLRYCPAGSGQKEITLCRYNGSDHEHQNPLEGPDKIHNFCHIHQATERYIAAGRKAEHYAVTTDRYQDLDGAFRALCEDCAIEVPGRKNPLSDVHDDLWGEDGPDDD